MASQGRRRGGPKPAWVPASGRAENADAPRMPEPRHRTGPAGVSSGVSLRSFPNASLENVQEICEHYVAKTSGKYGQSQGASTRYVYQMAQEITSQIQLLGETVGSDKQLISELEDVLKEWRVQFPTGADGWLRPAAIAQQLTSQRKKLQNLEMQLNEARGAHGDDVNQLRALLTSHQRAARRAQMQDRARQQHAMDKLAAEYDARLAALQEEHGTQLVQLAEEAKQREASLRQSHACEIDKLQQQIREVNENWETVLARERAAHAQELQHIQQKQRQEPARNG